MTSKEHSYSLILINAKGDRETILECEHSFERVRRVASKIKQRPGRKLILCRDGKELPGGPNALDREAYDAWIEKNRPEEGSI